MRIKVLISPTDKLLPINNQHIVNSYVHKCLGFDNEYHDAKNNYAVSTLLGGKLSDDKKYISYKDGAFFIVSSDDTKFMNKMLIGMFGNITFHDDMKFTTVEHIQEELKDGWNKFFTVSPFMVKKYTDKKNYTFAKLTDEDFSLVVQNHIINKTKKLLPDVDTSNIKVTVNSNNINKVKKIMIHNVANYSNRCIINICADIKVINMLYNSGIGQSCGSGFGTICKAENICLYSQIKK